MQPFDFRALLKAPVDQQLVKDNSDAAWADFGRRVHANMMSDRWLTAVNTAMVAANSSAQPVHHIARCLRAFVFSGAITR